MKVLYYHYSELGIKKAGQIISDLYLWGGAAVLNPTKKLEEIEQNSIICGIANGRVNNCFSLKDAILKYALLYKVWNT
jgi:hypothetical protein